MTRRVRAAVGAVTGSWAARLYLVAVVIAYVLGFVGEVTTPPEDGASLGFLYLILFTLPWSVLLPAALSAVPSDAVVSWLWLVFLGLGAVVNALAITLVSRRVAAGRESIEVNPRSVGPIGRTPPSQPRPILHARTRR